MEVRRMTQMHKFPQTLGRVHWCESQFAHAQFAHAHAHAHVLPVYDGASQRLTTIVVHDSAKEFYDFLLAKPQILKRKK